MSPQPTATTPLPDTRDVRMFPTLAPEQLARVRRHGRSLRVQAGDVLLQPGGQFNPMFVVVEGKFEIVRPTAAGEELVTRLQPGQFSGEANMLSGRPGFIRIRATEPGEVIEVEREQLL